MTPAEREACITRYEGGPALLAAALAETPREALQWRPAPGKWSVHEVIVHCADSESNAHMRIRYLIGESNTTIVGYDEAHWASAMDYHAHPLDLALATVVAVRANTVPLLRRLTPEHWNRGGRHTRNRDRMAPRTGFARTQNTSRFTPGRSGGTSRRGRSRTAEDFRPTSSSPSRPPPAGAAPPWTGSHSRSG